MRLFTAIDIPPAALLKLEEVQRQLQPAARIQWSPVANLHITTKFIGEWPGERLADLTRTLSTIRAAGPIPIQLSGLGFFPHARSPKIFWAGVQAPPSLFDLARLTDEALATLGVTPEKRAYSPHLTIARIKDARPLAAGHAAALQAAIGALESTDFATFEAVEFHLYRSKTGPSGSTYTKLVTFPLQRFVY